ncbi:hypothetical protein BMS3Abin01_01342 [bacterium BMS3Abin01]|nr:hypothetical protein BMS3Abin01_01342 [bacterium BMS3Abin01]
MRFAKPYLLFILLLAVTHAAWTGPAAAQVDRDPRLGEEQAKEIAASHDSVPVVTSTHPELQLHAAFSSRRRVWTISWNNPNNGQAIIEVEVDDDDGAVIYSHIDTAAYYDMLPVLTETEAVSIAAADERVASWLEGKEDVGNSAKLGDDSVWTVSFTVGDDTIAEVLVDDATGNVNEVRTGPQVAWSMARGYKGAFGRIINEPYVWLPLCFMFLLPFVRLRRPLRLFHLDLLVLLSFTVSHYYFNQGEIFRSVPLAYPPLVYLFLRLSWMGLRRRPRRGEAAGEMKAPRLNFSPRLMVVGLAALLVFRIVINIADSNVVDVGYSGVIGAQRIQERVSPYGNMTDDNNNGDTYGPLNYLLYVPFEAALPWSGDWDDLPAAHAVAIFFDLAAVAGMFFAGRRLGGGGRRGNTLGIALAYSWAAFPYTTFVLNSNVNDTMVAAFIIWGYVFLRSLPLGAVFLGFATQIKFFPAILAPLWASFPRACGGWPRRLLFIIAFLAALAAPLPIIFLGDGSLSVFWERSLQWQIGRESPFSIWGQYPDTLGMAQHIAQGILVALAVGAYLWPPRKTMYQLAAVSGALLVGFQLVQTHWFYLYIPWFFPMAMIAFIIRAGLSPAGTDPEMEKGTTIYADYGRPAI